MRPGSFGREELVMHLVRPCDPYRFASAQDGGHRTELFRKCLDNRK